MGVPHEECPVAQSHEIAIQETKDKVTQIEIVLARFTEKVENLVEALNRNIEQNRETTVEIKNIIRENNQEFRQTIKDCVDSQKEIEIKFQEFEKLSIKDRSSINVKYWLLIIMLLIVIGLFFHQIFPTLAIGTALLKIVELGFQAFKG